MQEPTISDAALLRSLNEHPQLRQRVAALLAVVDNTQGDLQRADDAELRVRDELRSMGQQALQAWAEQQVQRSEQALRSQGQAHREGKKNSAGTQPSVK